MMGNRTVAPGRPRKNRIGLPAHVLTWPRSPDVVPAVYRSVVAFAHRIRVNLCITVKWSGLVLHLHRCCASRTAGDSFLFRQHCAPADSREVRPPRFFDAVRGRMIMYD